MGNMGYSQNNMNNGMNYDGIDCGQNYNTVQNNNMPSINNMPNYSNMPSMSNNTKNSDASIFSKIQLGLYVINFIGVFIFGWMHGITFSFDLDSFFGFLLLYMCANILEIVIFIGIGIVQLVDIIKLRKGNGFNIFCFILNILNMIISIIAAIIILISMVM